MSVTRTFSFEAAHQLPWHQGKCRHLHGHTYRLEVTVTGPVNEDGIISDFSEIGALVRALIVDKYDHQFLNDHFDNPTAELLAVSFFKILEAESLNLIRLRLWETATSAATVESEVR